MINNKLQICKWYQCDIGHRYHHTGEEWDTHQQYSKTDIPKLIQHTEIQDIQNNQIRVTAMPADYSVPCTQGKHDNKWRMIALGTTIAVWSMIILIVLR